MKKILTLALALMTGLSFAQYNNTYDVNGNFDPLRPSFDIVNNMQESITVSDGHDPITNSNYFIYTKLNVAGGVVCNVINRAPNDPQEGYLYVEALHETINGEVIVGGYYYSDVTNIILQPFLARFDINCNMVWHMIYPVNQRNIVRADINKVSLCRVYDEPGENYLFAVAGDSDANPGVEVAVNVLKVNGANGALIFSNKYYPAVASPFPNLREYPGDIEYSPVTRTYMIAGYRQHANSGLQDDRMFHFSIFNNGVVYTPPAIAPLNYLTQISKSDPLDQDMVYDAVNDQFATVFTHENSTYVPLIQSEIGFVKVNPALNVFNPGIIWHTNGDIHNGRSISLASVPQPMPGQGFALGAGTRENVNPPFVNNPALQLVDNFGIPWGGFMRYNIWDDVYFYHHARNPNLIQGEFVLINEQATDLRVISTTPGGDDWCSVRYYDRMYQPYSPVRNYYQYRHRTFNKSMPYQLIQIPFLPPLRMCVPPGNSYRTTGLTSFTADKLNLRVYPSVVSKNNAELTIENGSGVEMKVEVRNITGQLIQTTDHVGSGKTTVTLSQGLSAGVYMVHFYNADGNISATEKILISE